MYNFNKGNIIYNEDSEIICLNCKNDLNNNIITYYENNTIKIKCKKCNNELKNYQLISCIKCKYDFLILHNYIDKESYILEFFKIYTQFAKKINKCTHLTIHNLLKIPNNI
jgi:hypothetical protein